MCVILSCENELPSYELLAACEAANPDGSGLAWVENERVWWRKGISAAEIHDWIVTRNIQPPIVVHFRLATVGGLSAELCHPFPCTPQAEVYPYGYIDDGCVLFHNGHITEWHRMLKQCGLSFDGGPISDSRAIAAICGKFPGQVSRLLSNMHQKFATLSPRGIELFGQWSGLTEFPGLKFSNLYFTNLCQ